MNAHHNHRFDHAMQMGNLWLRKIEERLELERDGDAYAALRATLHALRDRLMPEDAVHLSAQLPMVVRGLYFEGWRMSRTPTEEDNVEQFCTHIETQLPPRFPRDPRSVASGVFEVMWNELDPREIVKVIDRMPHALRILWPAPARLS
jgi:uncharacterized protein (DUF2267 family)